MDKEEPSLIMGEGEKLLHLHNNDQFRAVVDRITAQARRRISLLSQTLDDDIYNRSEFSAIISSLCRHVPRLDISIIVKDVPSLVKKGHRLIELQKRLPSIITLLPLAEEFDNINDEYLIVDGIAFVQRFQDGPLFGRGSVNNRALSAKLSRQFEDIKKHCSPSMELRRLDL